MCYFVSEKGISQISSVSLNCRQSISLQNSALCPKMCCKKFENRYTFEKINHQNKFMKVFSVVKGNYVPT